MAIERKRLGHVNEDGETIIIHFETEASIVTTSDGSNVEDRLAAADQATETLRANTEESISNLNQSIQEDISAKIEQINQNITNLESSIQQDISTKLEELQNTINNDITTKLNTLQGTVDSTISSKVNPMETALKRLLGDDYATNDQGGTLEAQIAEAISRIVADAPEDFQDLEAMYTWITEHETDAENLSKDVTELKTKMGVVQGSNTTTGSIAKQVKDAKDSLTTTISGVSDRVTALENKKTIVSNTVTNIEYAS